jgi:ribosome recycling factor
MENICLVAEVDGVLTEIKSKPFTFEELVTVHLAMKHYIEICQWDKEQLEELAQRLKEATIAVISNDEIAGALTVLRAKRILGQ